MAWAWGGEAAVILISVGVASRPSHIRVINMVTRMQWHDHSLRTGQRARRNPAERGMPGCTVASPESCPGDRLPEKSQRASWERPWISQESGLPGGGRSTSSRSPGFSSKRGGSKPMSGGSGGCFPHWSCGCETDGSASAGVRPAAWAVSLGGVPQPPCLGPHALAMPSFLVLQSSGQAPFRTPPLPWPCLRPSFAGPVTSSTSSTA